MPEPGTQSPSRNSLYPRLGLSALNKQQYQRNKTTYTETKRNHHHKLKIEHTPKKIQKPGKKTTQARKRKPVNPRSQCFSMIEGKIVEFLYPRFLWKIATIPHSQVPISSPLSTARKRYDPSDEFENESSVCFFSFLYTHAHTQNKVKFRSKMYPHKLPAFYTLVLAKNAYAWGKRVLRKVRCLNDCFTIYRQLSKFRTHSDFRNFESKYLNCYRQRRNNVTATKQMLGEID